MGKLGKQERAAIDAVARHFSATWENGDGESPDAYLTIAGKRIALDVAAIGQKVAERGDLARPRLRFDRVVLRLVGGLRAALSELVPDGVAVVLTVTAPIRLPSKTATALEGRIRDCLARRPVPVDVRESMVVRSGVRAPQAQRVWRCSRSGIDLVRGGAQVELVGRDGP